MGGERVEALIVTIATIKLTDAATRALAGVRVIKANALNIEEIFFGGKEDKAARVDVAIARIESSPGVDIVGRRVIGAVPGWKRGGVGLACGAGLVHAVTIIIDAIVTDT